jgi:uncharacterized protein
MKQSIFFIIILFNLSLLTAQPLSPQAVSISMRDGKSLAADVYVHPSCNNCPTILIQTPYNKNFYRWGLPLGVKLNQNNFGYHFVIVDWRGFYGSSAAMVAQPDRGNDGYDVIEWIKNQTWSDGKVGTWGPSALGRIQYETAAKKHPAHKCAVPLVAASMQNYQQYYPGGVYRTEYIEQLDALGYGLSTIIKANPIHNFVWNFSEQNSYYPDQIEIPMLLIGGWYDHNIEDMFVLFQGLRTESPVAVRNKHKFLIGPWAHGGFGQSQVGTGQQGELFFPKALGWNDSLAMMFFDFYLRGVNNNWENKAAIQYYLPGTENWYGSSQWPLPGTVSKKYYLHPDLNLKADTKPSSSTGESLITYDPRNPSPTIGGPTLSPNLLQGPYNQNPDVEDKNDVLIFSTPVLTEALHISGKIKVVLHVSTDRLDTDFAVRLTDVYPDNKSILLLDGIRRLRFRNGFRAVDTALAVPHQIYELEIELSDLAHTFKSGHQLRLIVSSSNFPRFDLNLNNGGEMNTAGDTFIAQNKVYHNTNNASYLELPVINMSIGLNEAPKVQNFKLYPNPAQNFLHLECNHKLSGNESLIIYNIKGEQVYKTGIEEQSQTINIESLSNGLYFYNFSFNGNVLNYGKIVVVR